jgi:hypothetical protein
MFALRGDGSTHGPRVRLEQIDVDVGFRGA